LKRSNAFAGGNTLKPSQLEQLSQNRFYESLAKRSVDPYANPFFDTMFNQGGKGSSQNLLKFPPTGIPNQYQVHTPSIGNAHMSHSGGLRMPPQHGNPILAAMEPPQMSQVPSYLSKFVAGPARLEANPLGEPARTIRTLSPTSGRGGTGGGGLQVNDFDLKNPDAQYERYKNLMANQYYNSNVNSMHIVPTPASMT
jgi:hypothetical protein